jgi:hypothetical protein
VTTVHRWTGREARALREALRRSVRSFAAYLGVGARTVASWDAGGDRVTPRPEMQAALDTALSKASEDERRRFAMLLAAGPQGPGLGTATPPPSVAEGAPAEPWRRMAYALDHPERLDPATMAELESYTAELFRLEEHLTGAELADHLRGHLDRLKYLLNSAPVQLRRRLLVTTGEAFAIAGWMAWDGGDANRARHLYDCAAALARQAGDGPLLACVFGYHSYLLEADGDLAGAQQVLAEAQRHVSGDGNAATRSWVTAREAEVSATLHEETRALRALDRATTAYDYARPHNERPWTSFYTPSRLGGLAVTVYAQLDHPELDAMTNSVLASLGTPDIRRKAVVLADVAAAAIQRGRYDQGAQLGQDALEQSKNRRTRLINQRLYRLRGLIRNKRHIGPLNELGDRLDDRLDGRG